MITFIGMGHLGANFVRALLKKGETVQVWNRTYEKAAALKPFGAIAFQDIADAVKGATTIHLTVRDDASVDEILEQASTGFEPGVLIIDHTTTSVTGAIARTEYWKSRGYTYQHAPVFMGPQNALESTGYMLVSGDQGVISALEPKLSAMTGTVMNLGPATGKAAAMKLTGNLFLMTLTAGITDALSLAKGFGIAPDDVAALFNAWNPAASMPARLKRLIDAKFDQPTWELNMARKDAGLMLHAAEMNSSKLMTIPSIAKEMDRWIENGHGQSDWMIMGKDALPD